MDKFWEALKESIITQSILTLAIWAAVIYLACTGQTIPEILGVGAGTILGYWFGSKNQYAISQVRKQLAVQVPPLKVEDD
jgi:uncharacterized membrane protein YfcA